MVWVTLQDRPDYWATQTSAAPLPVRASTATHTHMVSLKHHLNCMWGPRDALVDRPFTTRIWFSNRTIRNCCSPSSISSLRLLSAPPHLFPISCGLGFWRQKSIHPSSPLGVRPSFSTQTNNTACKRFVSVFSEERGTKRNVQTEAKEHHKQTGGKKIYIYDRNKS